MNQKKKTVSPRRARPVDHLVLPVGSLDGARARLTQLGFTVAPDARHPFGTGNCCVFFADGTYLEPLAVEQREDCEAAARKGNVFIARDQAHRFRSGDDGFSAIAFTGDDAGAIRREFERAGISAGRNLRFTRKFDDGKGNQARASFALAFAADLRAPDAFFFAVERTTPPPPRGRLDRHANGARSIRRVVLEEVNPSDFQYFMQDVINQRDQQAHSFGLDLNAANAIISVLNPDGMHDWFGAADDRSQRGLVCRGVVLGVRSLAKTREYLTEKAVKFLERAGRIIVMPAPCQGLFIAFEESK